MVVLSFWLIVAVGACTLLLLFDQSVSCPGVSAYSGTGGDIQKMEYDEVMKGTKPYLCNYLKVYTCQTAQLTSH